LNYRSPVSGEPLEADNDMHLYDRRGRLVFPNHSGSYDFVANETSQNERAYYDSTYANGGWWGSTVNGSLDLVDYDALWTLEPCSRHYRECFGDLTGKRVLLLGNGTSVKELLFVTLGAQVTFTDLSFRGVMYAKASYESSRLGIEHPVDCEFHAVDAYHLPFEDNTFDIVCADAVIHHLDDLKKLFTGIHRCLKPGGFCRFADTAYSPLWQRTKKGIMRPVQRYVHKKHGISPEDRKATERGGYSRQELEQLQRQVGFGDLYYQRVALLDYLLWRARCHFDARWLLALRPVIRWLDRMLAKTRIMETQGIALVFGFNK
jgi:SAM-dependent methyltransferase